MKKRVSLSMLIAVILMAACSSDRTGAIAAPQAGGFVEPEPDTFVVFMPAIREYFYYRKAAVIAGAVGVIAEVNEEALAKRHEQGWVDEPVRAHPMPPSLEKADLTATRITGAGQLEHLRFESEYQPQDPEIRDAYLAQFELD